jgi:hypothetical protein
MLTRTKIRTFASSVLIATLASGAGMAQTLTLHSKVGNNGTASCDIYCTSHAYDGNDPFVGSCIAAHWADAAHTPYTCYATMHPPIPLACLCGTF